MPTDFSAPAYGALPHALLVAQQHAADLVILHVLTPAEAYIAPGITGRIWDRLDQESRERVEYQLDLLAKQLQRPDLKIQTVLGHGVAIEEILRVAQRLACDLIVLATHGRTGVRRMLLGSVAEQVVRRSFCPVVLIQSARVALREAG
jgi:nucleotide-binding universal stress UspA family protein